MTKVFARVARGRLLVDEPTDLPEGSAVQLLVLDMDDDLSEVERRDRDAAIEKGIEQMKRGEVSPVDEVMTRLRGQ